MRKLYNSAPLPFVGQKRMFAKEFKKVLELFPDGTTFVDLFGGSGLLSHITKYQKPKSKVVYNDFDDYRLRLNHIVETNELLTKLRFVVRNIPKGKVIKGENREAVLQCLDNHLHYYGYLDFITISSAIMFSMKYCMDMESLRKETFYNNIRLTDYPLCQDYLEGLTIVSKDYKEIFAEYKDKPNVVFLVDPPYLNTDVGTYKMKWRLADYLDVLTILKGYSFVYFTSNKSSIIELCEWIGKNREIGNPFDGCSKFEFNAHMNYSSSYTDIMMFRKAG
jgi:hypothetical protein